MESGEGMVAIVRASKHTGLTVTVLPNKHTSCKRKYLVLDMSVKATRGCKSNVETNTEWVSKNSSLPLWDARCDSGYQFANCLQPPSSQRSSSHHSPPHHMVSFMNSLRRYPKVTSSADLIQRILDCACNRNHTKNPSKRSLLRKSTSSHTHRIGKKSDNTQTHKINRNSGRLDRSASFIGKRCSSQEELLNYTYDYLKSSSLIRRRTNVRYLTEIKRALKDRLREIIECRPTVCPKMESRYIMHKRNNCGSLRTPKHVSVATNNTETQVHLSTESKAVPNLTCESSSTSPKRSMHKACFCQPPTPCVCPKTNDIKILNEIKGWINDVPVHPNFSKEDKIRQDEMLKGLENTLKDLLQESHFNFKAKKEILKLLDTLPMWHPNDPNEDAIFREKLADNLIGMLGNAAEAIFEEEIAKGIENIPLDSEHINNDDITRISEKFAKRLRPIVFNHPPDEEEYKEALKSELLDLLEDVPLKYESQQAEVKSEIADKFGNELRTIKLPANKQTTTKQQEREIDKNVNDIFIDLPELSDLKASEKKKLTQLLKNKMGEYDPKDLEDSEIQQEIQRGIKEWLDNSAISERIDSKTKDKVTKKIMQELQIGNSKRNDEDTFSLINKWVQSIPELSGGDIFENKKALQELAAQLDEIVTSGEDPENIQVDIRETIADWLQNRLRKNHRRLSFTTQENLVNELVKKINDAPKKARHMQREGPDIYVDIVEWIKGIPHMDTSISDDQSSAIEDLMNTLNDIKNNSDEEDIESQTRDAINNFIDHLSNSTGVEIDPNQRNVLEKKLLGKMQQAPQQRKRWNKQDGFGSSTPNSYDPGHYSMSPDMSPIRNISVLDEQGEIDAYINTLNNLIDSWIKRLELSIDSAEERNLVSDIATDVVDRHKYLQISNNKTTEGDELEHLKYQIFRRLNKFNLGDLPRIIPRVNDLNKALVTIKVQKLANPLNRSDNTRNINNLVNSLKTWVDNISPDLARSVNKPYSDEVFIDLAKNLAGPENTIDHYHVKNEILQWIPKLFNNLSTNTLNNLADSLENHLMNDLAQSMTQDKTAGLMYRQMLRDTISKTLPSIHMTSANDLHAFDLLKERLVDAFINLHYFADDMVALDKFRTKLFNEVNNFCNEYLSRYPETPMNSEEISKNLYNALRKVSVPNIETIRSELEQVRLKEEILDWLPNVPIDKSKNMDPELNAMASGLAKRIHGLEKEKHSDPNKDNEMKQEIAKWLQKLPLKNAEQINLQDFADNLMDKIKSNDKPRTLSVSKIGKYDENINQARRSFQYPQSNLDVEDRAHLDRIRRRLEYSRGNRTRCLFRDASVSPPPRESGIQIEMDGRLEGSVQTRPSMYEGCNTMNRGVSPRVIIKEYYWDSTGSIISMRERTTDARGTGSPCSPCSKAAQTTPQLIRSCQRTKDTQTEQLNKTHPRSRVDRVSDKRTCSLGTLADGNPCIPPPCYFPEERRTYQRLHLPSDVIGSRSKVDTCCNCGQRIYTKCRARHSGCRPHCNLTCLKYCPNCGNGCPFPSNLYFRKEF